LNNIIPVGFCLYWWRVVLW